LPISANLLKTTVILSLEFLLKFTWNYTFCHKQWYTDSKLKSETDMQMRSMRRLKAK